MSNLVKAPAAVVVKAVLVSATLTSSTALDVRCAAKYRLTAAVAASTSPTSPPLTDFTFMRAGAALTNPLGTAAAGLSHAGISANTHDQSFTVTLGSDATIQAGKLLGHGRLHATMHACMLVDAHTHKPYPTCTCACTERRCA